MWPPRRVLAPIAALLLLSACGGEPRVAPTHRPSPSTEPSVAAPDPCAPPNEEAAVTDHWPVPPECELQPYPYVTPTPPRQASPIDGVYERRITSAIGGPAGKCRRCPPYRMERGQLNVLWLAEGVFRVVHRPGEFTSVGHFAVEGDTVSFVNDPNCPTTRGTYEWHLDGDELTFDVVDDVCAFGGLRWRYLTATPWRGTNG